MSLAQVSPNLDFWSDTLDVGWGAHLGDNLASGLWSPQDADLSINARELLAVERGLRHFAHLVVDSTVAIFADNSTAVAYLRKQGSTRSPLLNPIGQRILLWAESLPVVLVPQFIMGRNNVLADFLSRPNQIQDSKWTLKPEVFMELRKKWPAMIDLFATTSNHLCSLYFSPFHNQSALGMDAFLQNWDGYQVYVFPPWSLIPLVLKKLCSSSEVLMTLIALLWPQRPWYPDLLDLVVEGPIQLPRSHDLLRQPHFLCHHPGIHRLSLDVWRLSSYLPGIRDSRLK